MMLNLFLFGPKKTDKDSLEKLALKRKTLMVSLCLLGAAVLFFATLVTISGIKVFGEYPPGEEDHGFWTVFFLILFTELVFVCSVFVFYLAYTRALSPETNPWVYMLFFFFIYYLLGAFSLAVVLIGILLEISAFTSLFLLCGLFFGIYLWLFICQVKIHNNLKTENLI